MAANMGPRQPVSDERPAPADHRRDPQDHRQGYRRRYAGDNMPLASEPEMLMTMAPPPPNPTDTSAATVSIQDLNDQVVGLVSMLREERAKKAEDRLQLEKSLQRVAHLTDENSNVRNELANTRRGFESRLEKSRSNLSQTMVALDSAMQELEDKDRILAEQREELLRIQIEHEAGREASEKAQEELEGLKRALDKQKDELSQAQEETQAGRELSEQAQQELEELKRALDEQKDELLRMQEEMQKSRESLSQANQELEDKGRELTEQRQELSRARREIQTAKDYSDQVLDALHNATEGLDRKDRELDQTRLEKTKALDELKETMAYTIQRLTKANDNIALALLDSKEKLAKVEEDFKVAYKAHESLVADFTRKLSEAEDRSKNAETNLSNVNAQLQESRSAAEEKEKEMLKFKEECENAKEWKAMASEELDRRRTMHEEITLSLSKLESEQQAKQGQLQRLVAILSQREEELERLRQSNQETFSKMQEKITQLRQQDDEKEKTIHQLEVKLDILHHQHKKETKYLQASHSDMILALKNHHKDEVDALKAAHESDVREIFHSHDKTTQMKDNKVEGLQREVKKLERLLREARASQNVVSSDTLDGVVICVDLSGSLAGEENLVRAIFRRMITGIMARNPSTHVGLLTHGDSYGSLLDSRVIQRQALEPAKAEMADLLNDASAIGEEHYEEALVQAETMLKSFKSSYPNAGRRIILIGDGGCEFDDTGYAYGRPLVPWKKQCERLSNEGVPVHSIVVNPSDSYYSGGLPSSKDKHMLATISELTRGKSFSPVNAYDSAVFDSYEIAGRIPPKEPSTPSRASSISSASLMSPTVETRSTHRSTISVERFPVASSTVATVGRKSSNTPTPVPAPPPKPRGRLFKLGSTFDKRSRRGDSKTHP